MLRPVTDDPAATASAVDAEGDFRTDVYERGYADWFRPDDRTNPFQEIYARKRESVLDYFGRLDPMSVVDVGGGPGRLSAPLALRHRVTYSDISDDMIEIARRVCPPGVRFVKANATELPFEDGEFDALLSLDVLCHLPGLEEGLRELSRVVRPGGRLVVDTTNSFPLWVLTYPRYVGPHPRRLVRTLGLGGVLPEWRKTVRHDRPREVVRAIDRAGLELERMERFGRAGTTKWHLWYVTKPAT